MTCLSCGAEIPDKRLRAMPLAEFCVKCQPEPKPIRAHDVPDALAESPIDLSEMWGR